MLPNRLRITQASGNYWPHECMFSTECQRHEPDRSRRAWDCRSYRWADFEALGPDGEYGVNGNRVGLMSVDVWISGERNQSRRSWISTTNKEFYWMRYIRSKIWGNGIINVYHSLSILAVQTPRFLNFEFCFPHKYAVAYVMWRNRIRTPSKHTTHI